ncbi:syncoilin [Paramormyrops kingsleyae]|uniref:Syncoilin, intermediate filament protein n=1 Tax=Paramormyrops kingsleyae TaxID=1676925 RepID=A0A3B3QUM9_9TELE|nr:syncoilin [Paramormyrops kingsleyae]
MDSKEAPSQLKPTWGILQEASVGTEGNRMQEADLQFKDQMEESGTDTKSYSEGIMLQFGESMDWAGVQLEGAAEDPRGSLEGLSVQFEECLHELGALLLGQSGGMDSQIEGCLGEISTQLEECTRELVAQLEDSAERDSSRGDSTTRPSDEAVLGELGLRFEACIAQVGALERHRDQLVAELLALEEPMAREAQELRAELAKVWRQLAQSELERRSLRGEVLGVRKRLFAVVRECTQSRIFLDTLQRDVKESVITQEKLQAELLRLTEEAARLQLDQQNHLNDLQSQLSGAEPPPAAGELSQCREASRAIQQQLQSGVQALQELYEPRLQALLARRQASAEATRRCREESRELRAQLSPLREEAQRLALQKAYLEERLALMQQEREENLSQHREALDALEENRRHLKTETEIQQKKNQDIENVKRGLEEELRTYRYSDEVRKTAGPAMKEET